MAKAKTQIEAPAVFNCVDKQTGERFYAVPSDHPQEPGKVYEVRWDEKALRWHDNCPSKGGDCKHVRAVREVIIAKFAAKRAANRKAHQVAQVAA